MTTSPRQRFLHPAAAFLLLAACGGDDGHDHTADAGHDCDEDTRDEAYLAGMEKVGEAGYTLTLMDSLPAPPDKGDNVWTVEVKDNGGAPVDGLTIDVDSFMPDHQHGSPIEAVSTSQGDGVYELDPVNLFMPGYWEITVAAMDGETELDSVMFKFCIDG